MRILIDSLSSQVQVQFQGISRYPAAQSRLNTLLGAMRSGGTSLLPAPGAEWETCFSCAPITADQLDGVDVFFVMTHHPVSHAPNPAYAWSDAELGAITAFVRKGGGLLLMSNHAPYPLYDAALAERFGVTLQNVMISNPAVYMKMCGDRLNREAFGKSFLFGVDALASHDGCAISASASPVAEAEFTWLAAFPPDATNRQNGQTPPEDWYYAAQATLGRGRAIFVANSGTVGDFGGNPAPACGGIASANNLMFTLNCLRVLGGQPQPAALGYCPGGEG